MSKEEINFKNRDRFIQLGIAISALRKMRGMSQDQLAEKANISRSHLRRRSPGRHYYKTIIKSFSKLEIIAE